jgi:putative peptidoglycan lipid II flippase
MILCAYGFRNSFDEPVYALALGVMIGGALQLLLQLPFLKHLGFPFRFGWNLRHPGLRRIFVLLVPVFFGQAVREVNVIVGTMLAWYLGEGMVSALYYSYRLMHLPLAVFGLAIATALLPSLSNSASIDDMEEFKRTLSSGLKSVLFIMIPATVGLIVLRVPIIRLLFEHGSFDTIATDNTAFALMFYAIGLFVFAGSRVLTFAFYAMKNTTLPVVVAACAMVANVIFSVALMGPLRQGGLALASSISSAINMLVLWIFLEKKIGGFGLRSIVAAGVRTCLLSAIMGILVYGLALVCARLAGTTTVFGQLVHVVIPISGGLIFYLGAGFALRLEEAAQLREVWNRRRRR